MGLFGNLFDFDGDGEEDLMETMLGIGLVSALFDELVLCQDLEQIKMGDFSY